MNNARWEWTLLLAAWCVLAVAAQDSERSRYYIQQMIELAATPDEAGVTTMQRMLEQEPRPASPNAVAARAALQHGQAALRAEDLNAALTAFQQASQQDPASADAFNYLGLVQRKLGRLTDAEHDLQQALALEPARAVA